MSIEIRIVIPDDDINTADALRKRMRLLGYAPDPHFSVAALMNAGSAPLTDSDAEEKKANTTVAEPTGVAEQHKAEAAAEQAARTKRSRKKAEEPQIRSNPEALAEVDNEATAAQDEADEQAEVEATRAPETPVTIDDLKKVVGEYVSAFSIPIAQEDGPKIFKSVLGEPPAGAAWTFPVLAGLEQAKLAAVVNAWKSAVADATTSKKRFGGV